MPITYDIEKDILYQRGVIKGIVKGKEEEIKLQKAIKEAERDEAILKLYKRQVSIKTIVESLSVSQYRVRKVIKEWKENSDKN